MSIATYREQTEDLRILANHYHSCIDDAERALWVARARCVVVELTDCKKKTTRDYELREIALHEVMLILRTSTVVENKTVCATSTAKTTNTRAFNYNKSASRAVRLRRAAKTARKSACWH